MILPPVRDQGQTGTCLYNAICSIMEAKLRMKGISVRLSVDYLKKIAENRLSSFSGPLERAFFTDVMTILHLLTLVGIETHEDYQKGCCTGIKYKIKSFQSLTWFKSTTPAAIAKLKSKGPLLAVIKISKNYSSDFYSGDVYRFNSGNPSKDGNQTKTHAVMSTGYGIDHSLPLWEMLNSHGEIGKEKGFGYFDFDSLAGLFSIDL